MAARSTKTTTPDDDQVLDDDAPEAVEAPADEQATIAEEWADEYDEGTELFVGKFDADDFDPEYGVAEFPEGTTIAVKRCLRKPPPGWIRKHAHLSDLERTFALIEKHCSERALEILDSLVEDEWNDFVEAWGKDGGLIEGKISQVCAAARQVEDALRRDLLCAGREFDDGTLSWDDLYAFVYAAPPNTAIFHAFEKGWNTTDYLLAHAVDALRVLIWQKTEDATKDNPRHVPDPFPRPGDADRNKADSEYVAVGSTVATKTTVGKFLAMRAEREKRWREKHNKGQNQKGA
ncbi:tail assembly chaperone [Mycobacterium phage Ekdilam]|uniref:Tail assembly chaperone n=1 Tax=Mycobacterium phage Ekdilam TaxID=2599862 RepID=A0A5J6TKU6_9CAUD|nr:tail assembly chaperone [Mycobacterium phage Ekdilam]QFG11441.1 tail assembly chaperone [Mycobacterium phage Ekdilam]